MLGFLWVFLFHEMALRVGVDQQGRFRGFYPWPGGKIGMLFVLGCSVFWVSVFELRCWDFDLIECLHGGGKEVFGKWKFKLEMEFRVAMVG